MYNSECTIFKCVQAIINQTYQNLEILLIDDYSKDNTVLVANKIAQTDSRIRIIQNKRNMGAGLTRNIGLDHATGDWTTFCDADDIPDPTWISDFIKEISDYNIDLIVQGFYCNNWPYGGNPRIVSYNGVGNRDEVVDALCKQHTFGYLWCKMYKSSIINDHNLRFTDIVMIEDEMFNLQYLKYVHQIACTDKCNYHYDCPDFYAKYGHIDNFRANLNMFITACDSFGGAPLRIKDMYVERTSDWLLSSYKLNQPDKHEKLLAYCQSIGSYLPHANCCRRAIRLLRFFIFPNYITLSDIGLKLYICTIGRFKK